MNLMELGWHKFFEDAFRSYQAEDPALLPARVAREDCNQYLLYCEQGIMTGQICGRMRHADALHSEWPAVGDWIAAKVDAAGQTATIQAVLPRKSKFSRRAAGARTYEQILAANVDTVLIVNGLDGDFNVRRIERYLAATWESGANPVIILNKSDVCPDLAGRLAEVKLSAAGAPVHALSAISGAGLQALTPYLLRGQTLALLGSSGVGKSTLVNTLVGDCLQDTTPVRHGDNHGRHTTTRRELILLPSGAILLDTPGLRELQFWDAGDALQNTFGDVEVLAGACRFSNCRHQAEPGCAVLQALQAGTLSRDRLRSYEKLQRELQHAARKNAANTKGLANPKWEKVYRAQKAERPDRE